MQSEEFDKRIIDAAEHHYPAYNEKAWSKMERLLDTHMPQEDKNRRRGILFLLLFLLLSGGVTWYFLTQPGNNTGTGSIVKTGSSPDSQGSATVTGKPSAGSTATPLNGQANTQGNPTGPGESTTSVTPATLNNKDDMGSTGILELSSKNPASIKKLTNQAGINFESNNPKTSIQQDPIVSTVKPGISEQPGNPIVAQTEPKKLAEKLPDLPAEEKVTESNDVKKAEEHPLQTVKKSNEAEEARAKKQNSLSFSLSAGPDISGVGYNFGKVQPVYGFGLGYTFRDRFTVRTGLYVASKIYTASPKEYKPDYPIPNFNYLQKIDADCRVYEIPLIISYNFGGGKKHNWFAAAGLSSYLMKKETYDYYYKYPGGATYIHTREINNENKHFFSGVSLSGGYTRQLNKTFSLSAEPYVKLPLSGVGAGYIRLQSAGLLISVTAKLTGNKK
jgi:hypothetical protein